ncbi:MAG: helix-turn-helix domain-containing protein [Alphaproteobacteria bacterium]|nr:helix-turn-helix domain-containing protein [Alphaproteobacteria bacterium]
MCIAGGMIRDIGGGSEIATGRSEGSHRGVRPVATHQHLYYEGDDRTHVFVVESGWVKLYRTLIDGQRQIVGFANAGSVLGLESEDAYCNGCEAITPVAMLAIPVERIRDLSRTDAKFADDLLRQVGRQLGAAQRQIATIGVQSAEQKLATFLISIADLCGAGAGGEFDLPMRRGDMGEFLGLRVETISRKMTEFQRRGWISMPSVYHCRLLRRDILEELADGGEIEVSPVRCA